MSPGPSGQVQVRQDPAPHREQPGADHDDPDDHIDDAVEPSDGDPLGQAEMGQLARQGGLHRERQ